MKVMTCINMLHDPMLPHRRVKTFFAGASAAGREESARIRYSVQVPHTHTHTHAHTHNVHTHRHATHVHVNQNEHTQE